MSYEKKAYNDGYQFLQYHSIPPLILNHLRWTKKYNVIWR